MITLARVLASFFALPVLVLGTPLVTNNVLYMDGDFDFVEVQDSPSLSNLAQITAEAWIHPFSGSFPTNGREDVISQYSSWLGQHPYALIWDRPTQTVLGAVNEDEGGAVGFGTLPVPVDTWTHVALTHDGKGLRVYVNGQLDAEVPNSIPGVVEYDLPVLIGAQAGGIINWFPGLIDECRVWGVARTQAEILSGMGGLAPGDDYGLLAYWRMNDRNGFVADSSGFGNDGQLRGNAVLVGLDEVPSNTENSGGRAQASEVQMVALDVHGHPK